MDNFLIAKATDVGVTREVNEDSLSVFDSPNGQVLVVCDGMGGQAAGDLASQLSINIIENILTDNTFSTPEEAIRKSIMAANQGVLNKTMQHPELEGMGSTCVMLIIKDGKVHCGWVGDSRIYYIADNKIQQVSHDQSYVQQLVDTRQITREEAEHHPQKNEITNCIGLSGMTPPETTPEPIIPKPGSVFLLCSDGLSSMVDDRSIANVVNDTSLTLQQRADKLISMANEAGGLDNITLELVQFSNSSSVGATSGTLFMSEGVNPGLKRKKKNNVFLYAGIAIACIVGAGFIGKYCFGDKSSGDKEKTEVKVVKTKSSNGDNKTQKKVLATPPSNTQAVEEPQPQPQQQTKTSSSKKDDTNAIKKAAKQGDKSKGNSVAKAIEEQKKPEEKPEVSLKDLPEVNKRDKDY